MISFINSYNNNWPYSFDSQTFTSTGIDVGEFYGLAMIGEDIPNDSKMTSMHHIHSLTKCCALCQQAHCNAILYDNETQICYAALSSAVSLEKRAGYQQSRQMNCRTFKEKTICA